MVLSRLDLYTKSLQFGIEQLDIPITSKCNLNCKYCNAFSPIADNWSLNMSDFKSDMRQLSFLFNQSIKRIHILGGEPLLNKDLISILETTRLYFPKSDIKLITNGILLDKMPYDFYKCISDNKITIDVTKYPGVDVKCPVEFKINNRDKMNKYIYDLTGNMNKSYNFNICPLTDFCVSFTLYEKKIYVPCLDPYIKWIEKYLKTDNLPEDSGEDIYKYNNYKDLLEKLFSKIPDACRFCKDYINDMPWELSDRTINEYVL